MIEGMRLTGTKDIHVFTFKDNNNYRSNNILEWTQGITIPANFLRRVNKFTEFSSNLQMIKTQSYNSLCLESIRLFTLFQLTFSQYLLAPIKYYLTLIYKI